jgi:DNA repair protein RadC
MKSLRELEKFDKPRKKLATKGVEALKNDELLSVLLSSGIKGKDVRKLSKEIISLFEKNFDGLSLDNLCEIHGLGVS